LGACDCHRAVFSTIAELLKAQNSSIVTIAIPTFILIFIFFSASQNVLYLSPPLSSLNFQTKKIPA
jgi:hypothetical protein